MRVDDHPLTNRRPRALPPRVLSADRRTEVDKGLAASPRALVDANDPAGHSHHLGRVGIAPWLRKPGRNSRFDLLPDAPRMLITAPSATEKQGLDLLQYPLHFQTDCPYSRKPLPSPPSVLSLLAMEQATVNQLTAAQLTESERRTIEQFAARLDNEMGTDLRALWLYGSRARGTAHPESDIDLLVIAEGGRDRYGRTAGDLSEEIAFAQGESPFNYSVHVHDPEWLRSRREIESFFIQEVDRDKIVLAGSALD